MSRTTFPAAKCLLVIIAAVLAGCPANLETGPVLDVSQIVITLGASRTIETFTISNTGGGEDPLEWAIDPANGPVNFRSRDPGYFYDLHNESRRQYVITISGQVDVEIGD